MMADVFESLIGAIYLDGGMEAARRFIVRHIEPEIDAAVDGQGGRELQEPSPAGRPAPVRRDAELPAAGREGPGSFEVLQDCGADRRRGAMPRPGAATRRKPSSDAAFNALCQLAGEPLPFESD